MKAPEIDEKKWLCDHFDQLMAINSVGAKHQFILSHPVLLSSNVIALLKQERGRNPDAQNQLDQLTVLMNKYWNQPQTYPIGYGPIEKIVDRLLDGEIQIKEAIPLVKDPNCSGLISPLYIRSLMKHWVQEIDIDLNFTMNLAKLAIEAANAVPLPNLSIHVMMQVAEGYMLLAHSSLMKRPDGQVLTIAINLGKWAAKVANASKRPFLESEFLHMMGAMTLDAYGGNFPPSEEYAENIDVWLERAVNPMPPPREGFKIAKQFLEDALPLRTKGSPYGMTTKVLMEAIIYEDFYTERNHNVEGLTQMAEEAKENLDKVEDALHIQRIDGLMALIS